MPIDPAEPPCKHILTPGEAHCRVCGDQILFTSIDAAETPRTIDIHDRLTGLYHRNVALVSIPLLLLIGPFLISGLVLCATYRWVKAQFKRMLRWPNS